MRDCIGPCREPLPESSFRKSRSGGLRNVCKACEYLVKMTNLSAERKHTANQEASARQRKRRAANPAWAIFNDSKFSDKKHGRAFGLTLDFVQSEISKACTYCGETALRMTLDRIDNSVGHTVENVTPACIRCNLARGTMPFEAWKCLLPGLRQAREQGAFGDWTGRIWRSKYREQ